MIQVCAQCGTRWNVRGQQRIWCPRCNGTLLAPAGPAAHGPSAGTRQPAAPAQPVRGRGFRWIAVRPGPPPPPRRTHRPLGPTPRYRAIPRWGLVDHFAPPAPERAPHKYVTASTVRTVLLAAGAVFVLAVAVHALRYLLLLINRTTLLPPFIAIGSLLAGIFVSLGALVAVGGVAVTLTSWLLGRRAEAFAKHEQADPRPTWMVWAGCLVPPVNFVFAPLFVIELAQAERCRDRQKTLVLMWAAAWIVAALICGWATWSGLRAAEPQAVADHTVTMIVAYLAGLAVLALLWRVLTGFTGSTAAVAGPTHRWVVVPPDGVVPAQTDADLATHPAETDTDQELAQTDGGPVGVESRDREPAA